MAYKRVYAPNGEPFDVPETRANDLILQKGWTQQPPVVAVPALAAVEEDVLVTDPPEDSGEQAPKRRRKQVESDTAE